MTSNGLCDKEVPLKLKGQILSDICNTGNVIWNKVLDSEEPTLEYNKRI